MEAMQQKSTALSREQQSVIEDPKIIYLVEALARKTCQLLGRPPSDQEELRNVGLGVLPEIVLRFDTSKGVTFVSFAYVRIRGSMIDHIRMMTGYRRRGKKAATHVSISASRNLDILFYGGNKAQASSADPISYDERTWAQGNLDQSFDQGTAAFRYCLIKNVRAAFERLDKKERDIIALYYFEGKTLEEVSQQIGYTKSWTSRLHDRVLAKLRHILAPTEETTSS